MRPHLQCCVKLWGLQCQKDTELLGQGQRIREEAQGMEHLCYGARLRDGAVRSGGDSGLPVPKGDLQESRGGALSGSEVIGQRVKALS